MAPFAILLGGMLLFALTTAMTITAIRLCLRYPRGATALLAVGALVATGVGLLWYDGRIARYFAPVFWVVIAGGFPVGVWAGRSIRWASLSGGLWVVLFGIVFAVRLPLGVSMGTAAAIGYTVETLVVAFTGFPAVIAGTILQRVARKHLPADSVKR